MKIISISWRNLWRHKLRSSVVMTAVFIGLAAGVFSNAFMYGMMAQRLESTIMSQVSNFQVHNRLFVEEDEYGFLINDPDKIIRFLKDDHKIENITPRLLASGMISSPTSASGVSIRAVDPEREKSVTNLHERIIEGEYLPGSVRNPVYIGEKLADELSVSVRSRVVITFQDPEGNITGGAFRVAGIYRTENSGFDMMNIFVSKNDFVNISSYSIGDTHEIAVRLDDDSKTADITGLINSLFEDEDILARPWQKLQPELGMMSEMLNQIMYVLIIIILFALGFTITNTMLMAVMERYHEFGVLLAVGMKKSRVFFMVMAEAVMLSMTGAAAGMAVSFWTIHFTGRKGIDISAVGDGLSSLGFSAVIYPSIEFSFYIGVTLLVILTALLSAVYPAVKALRLKPAEAIRIQ